MAHAAFARRVWQGNAKAKKPNHPHIGDNKKQSSLPKIKKPSK
jgi:hypothetical protein